MLGPSPLKKLLKTTSPLWKYSPCERLGFLSQKWWSLALPCSETGWTHMLSFLVSFYFSLISWCHLIAVIFSPFVFSWAWVNWKCMTRSHTALSKCGDIVEQSVFGADIYSSRGATDGGNHWSWASVGGWNSSIPKEMTLFCYVPCSTYDRCYRLQNWGQQNKSMSTLQNKISWSWSARE